MDIKEAIQIINDLHDFDEAAYAVAEAAYEHEPKHVGSKWDHPRVKLYRNAVRFLRDEGCLEPAPPVLDKKLCAQKLITTYMAEYLAARLRSTLHGNDTNIVDDVRTTLSLPNLSDEDAMEIHTLAVPTLQKLMENAL